MGIRVWALALGVSVLLAIPCLASASELSDEDYVTRYFGTSVVFITAKQLVDARQGYWGEKLPQEFMYSQGVLIERINEARRQAGRTDLLNPAEYPIGAGMEFKRDDGRWEYNIDFRGCRPSEVQVVLDSVEFTGMLSDCEMEIRPLCVGYLAASSKGLSSVELKLSKVTVTLTPDMTMKEMLAVVKDAINEQYGDNNKADIYISLNDTVTGGDQSFYVNVSVYLDGAEKQYTYSAYAEYEPNEM